MLHVAFIYNDAGIVPFPHKIRCCLRRRVHRIIVEYELWTDKWKKEKAEGKWKDAPNYGLFKKGHIALQDHGSEAWFKNIKIKVL